MTALKLDSSIIKNQKLADLMTARGASFKAHGGEFVMRLPFSLAAEISQSGNAYREAINRTVNALQFDDMFSSERNGFAQGTHGDLLKSLREGIDLKNHQAKLTEFERGDTGRLLKATVEEHKPRRRPRLNDSDGSWDFSKRFDDKPFLDFPKQRQTQKVIEVWVNFSISAYVKADEINAFGAYVWSVIRLIESAGLQTRLVLAMPVSSVYRGSSTPDGSAEVLIKESSHYLSPAVLAATFTALFYRRTLFALHQVAADLIGADCSSSIGHCRSFPQIEFSNGRLTLSADSQRPSDAELLEQLTKIFTQNKGA
jgi:hypothetical protein